MQKRTYQNRQCDYVSYQIWGSIGFVARFQWSTQSNFDEEGPIELNLQISSRQKLSVLVGNSGGSFMNEWLSS